MCGKYRLSNLKVCEARHDGAEILLCLFKKGFLDFDDQLLAFFRSIAEVEIAVHAALIVTASSGMKTTACGSDNFGEALFNCHVNVFVFGVKDKLACFNFFADFCETFFNQLDIFCLQNTGFAKHRYMRHAALDIVRAETSFYFDDCTEFFNKFRRYFRKTTAPHFA